MKLFMLADVFPPIAEHSGYQLFCKYIPQWHPDTQIFTSPKGILPRLLGKAYSYTQGWPPRNQSHAAAEAWFRLCGHPKSKGFFYHIMHFDEHHWLWNRHQPELARCVTTIHHPWPRPWDESKAAKLKYVANAMLLSHAGWEWYCEKLGEKHVWFTPYGVDIDFFYPSTKLPDNPERLLFMGQNGRNTQMLYRVFQKLCQRFPNMHLDCTVPVQYRNVPGLLELQHHPNVTWYAGVSDEALRELYWQNYLLFTPFQESGANTAVVEALACGLPIVTTDIGGIRDYGGGSIFPLVANNDDDACVDLITHYIARPAERNNLAKIGRKFAEDNFSLPYVSKKTWEVLKNLMELQM